MKIKILDNATEETTEVKSFISEWNNDNQSIEQFTSGSTGTPKRIKIPKWKMVNSAKMTGEFLELHNCKSSLLCISTKYIGGKMMVVRSILYDLTIYTTNIEKNPIKNLEIPIDFAAMVPLQVEETLQYNPEKLNLIKHLIIGGAPTSNELINKLKEYSCNVYSTFGMTETVSHIALRNLKNENNPYIAIGNTKFSSIHDCLVINCEDLGIKDLITTDIVDLIDDKKFYWRGRKDFVINSGGIKIHPEEVERKIGSIVKSYDFIIGQLPDQKLGSKVVFIGEKHLDTPDLISKVEAQLSRYERPKNYYFIPSLKRTPSGKIDRIKTNSVIQ